MPALFSLCCLLPYSVDIRVDLCAKFLDILSHPLIHRLTIGTNIPAVKDEARALFSTIYPHCPHSKLTVLDLHLGHFNSHVSISVPMHIPLDDKFVKEMAMAWPRIEDLAFDRPVREEFSPSFVTLPGLNVRTALPRSQDAQTPPERRFSAGLEPLAPAGRHPASAIIP
ncbi:hypothetical protein FB451DRAFT_1554129 [Mycena latifolia]|nr:hypothetical protein FB451DRAFT_1554129 [Mycena latifolia]